MDQSIPTLGFHVLHVDHLRYSFPGMTKKALRGNALIATMIGLQIQESQRQKNPRNWIRVMPKVSQEHKDKVRGLIFEAALKNFSKNGYSNTKMDDIASTANVSKGTLYLYFQSKEDLFNHMCKQNNQILIDTRSGLFKDKSKLVSDLGKFYDDLTSREKDTERLWLEGVAESLHNQKIRHVLVTQRQYLVEIVTEFLKQMRSDGGFFSDNTDLKSLARGMIALYNGLTIMRLTKADESIKDAWVKTMFSIISRTDKKPRDN